MARKTTTKSSRGERPTPVDRTPRKKSTKKSTTRKSSAKKSTTKTTASKSSTRKSTTKKSTTRKASTSKSPVRKSTASGSSSKAAAHAASAPSRSPDPSSREGQAARAVAQGHTLTPAQLRKIKSGLGRKEMAAYRRLLLEKRAELLGDVASLQNDVNEKSGNLSNMPLHMADVGSDHYEQEFTLGLMESERKLLREIDDAILRIGDGTYGVCMVSGLPIGTARLDAKPWAKYCIEVVREREKRGQY